MSSASKSLLKVVNVGGEKVSTADALGVLLALPDGAYLTTSESAVLLRESVTTLERWRRDAIGPRYAQGGAFGAKGSNQKITYEKADLIAYKESQKVSGSMKAAIRKGQAFATLMDLAEEQAFYVDGAGRVESMVEENLVQTVVDRLGLWEMVWLTPVEAASRTWSDLAAHQSFAGGVLNVLSRAQRGVDAGVEATDIGSGIEAGNGDRGGRRPPPL
jgi:hypothetical protein